MAIDFGAFGACGGDGSDTTSAARAAVSALRQSRDRRLVIPPGRYDFYGDRGTEEYLFVSNNDEGLQRIAFDLFDLDDIEIDGQGSTLIFRGPVLPAVLLRSRGVTLRNLTIDCHRRSTAKPRCWPSGPTGST
jgi:hypothetical protein